TAYPGLENIQRVPASVADASGFDLPTWRDFLKISLDYFVRGGGSLAIDNDWRKWLGLPFPQTYLIERDSSEKSTHQRRWPRAKASGQNNSLVRLLAF